MKKKQRFKKTLEYKRRALRKEFSNSTLHPELEKLRGRIQNGILGSVYLNLTSLETATKHAVLLD